MHTMSTFQVLPGEPPEHGSLGPSVPVLPEAAGLPILPPPLRRLRGKGGHRTPVQEVQDHLQVGRGEEEPPEARPQEGEGGRQRGIFF